MQFNTNIKYNSRESKSEYVLDKYQSLFTEKVLDVGADAMYLKKKITSLGGNYLGVGYGDGIDIELNLEKFPLPFKDNEFETVICLDVLEHLENIHMIFDELCRIASKNIVISLPNPWSDFFTTLRVGDHSDKESIKFYGLPTEKPSDRHRWFFNEKEAYDFVSYRSNKNGWNLVQFDSEGDQKKMGGNSLKGFVGRSLLKSIFRTDIDKLGLHHSTLWFTLEKNG